jgi:N-acylneuraminate cytidylyltransferase
MKIAVIPARGGSKRIPGKNIKPFLGRPIIGYSIEAARESRLFDKILVSTDSEEIAEVARREGASVPFLRPAPIADDHAPVLDVLHHAVEWYAEQGQAVEQACLIYATAPFLRADDLVAGYRALGLNGCRSSMSVAKFLYPIQRALQITDQGSLEMIQKQHMLTRSQDLAEAYMDAAQFIWTTPSALVEADGSLLDDGVAPVIIPTSRVQDIDTQEDWDRAQFLYEAARRWDAEHRVAKDGGGI